MWPIILFGGASLLYLNHQKQAKLAAELKPAMLTNALDSAEQLIIPANLKGSGGVVPLPKTGMTKGDRLSLPFAFSGNAQPADPGTVTPSGDFSSIISGKLPT